jgi:putative PIN family toxin of toxin-antitoxin system
MNIVLDTNVLIAAFISHGTCNETLEHCIRYHNLITSKYILNEFRNNLISKFKFSKNEVAEASALLLSRMTVVTPSIIPKNICDDHKDLPILGTAVKGKCQCIITGDNDLLRLDKYNKINIIAPNDFLKSEYKTRKKTTG